MSKFEHLERGLIITERITFDEWKAEWHKLEEQDKSLPFAIGDMMVFGELSYGEMYTQVLCDSDGNPTGHFRIETLRQYKYVANRWPIERRGWAVSWGFYQATAALDAEKQDEIMEQALFCTMNRQQVRALARTYMPERQALLDTPPPFTRDVIEELEQDNRAKDKRIAELESTQPVISFTLANAPADLPAYVTHAIEAIQNWLGYDGGEKYTSVTISVEGETWQTEG